jgi:hypothetical protein
MKKANLLRKQVIAYKGFISFLALTGTKNNHIEKKQKELLLKIGRNTEINSRN